MHKIKSKLFAAILAVSAIFACAPPRAEAQTYQVNITVGITNNPTQGETNLINGQSYTATNSGASGLYYNIGSAPQTTLSNLFNVVTNTAQTPAILTGYLNPNCLQFVLTFLPNLYATNALAATNAYNAPSYYLADVTNTLVASLTLTQTNNPYNLTNKFTFFSCQGINQTNKLPSLTILQQYYAPGAEFVVKKVDGNTNWLYVLAGTGMGTVQQTYGAGTNTVLWQSNQAWCSYIWDGGTNYEVRYTP